MNLSDEHRTFVAANTTAAMITVGSDGLPKPARVAVWLVDDRLVSSSTASRTRTARLRRDPRCTLFVFESGPRWLGLEAKVAIHEGPGVDAEHLRLFRIVQGKPTGPLSWFGGELDDDAFTQAMRDEGRVLYDFDITRAYGLVY